MYKAKRRFFILSSNAFALAGFFFFATFFAPKFEENTIVPIGFTFCITSIIFLIMHFAASKMLVTAEQMLETSVTTSGETSILAQFITRLRFCYSLDDLTQAIIDVIEKGAGCSVLYIDARRNYVLYNSPDRLTSSSDLISTIHKNYHEHWKPGYYFIGNNYGVTSSAKKARGFFLSSDGCHFFIFCRYTKLFDNIIYSRLYEEFVRFQKRRNTIDNLSQIAELSKQWQQLAQAQRSFLPAIMPIIDKVEFDSVFKPLVNVSGDYYTVLPIDESKTLVMLGDVSGKGLAAALVMGLVMNTVKIINNKEDLPSMIKTIDSTIKSMRLQDKYTVLFIGIIDTKSMTIRYVNASMSDPLIVTKAPDGYRIKPLESNCSIIGIIDIDNVEVAQRRLFRGDLIFMSSDGISETMNEKNEELGDTKLYTDTIKTLAAKSPSDFVNGLYDLAITYCGEKKLHDDITMLVAKVGG